MKIVFEDKNENFMVVGDVDAVVVRSESERVVFSNRQDREKVKIPIEDVYNTQDTILGALEGSGVIDLRRVQDGPAEVH